MPISANFKGEFGDFYAAVDKATGKLVDFGAGASKVGTQLNRMVDTFSGKKLIQDATLMVKAIDEVGGVSKLTAKELAGASAKAQEAAEKMKAMGLEVPKGLQDVADAGQKSSVSLDSVTKSALGLAAGYFTVQAAMAVVSKTWDLFIGFMSDSIKAASDAEASQSKLIAAMRAQNTALPATIELYDEYAAQLQRTTTFEDDAAQAAMALLVQIGDVMPKDMEKALQASADLSAGLGIDLNEAATMVAKAANGSVTALNKLGVETKDVHGKTKDFEGVLASIEEKFGGQAAAAANTYAGRIQQLKNAYDDVQESVGRAITTNATFLGVVQALTGGVADNTGELSHNKAVMEFISDVVIVAVKAFAFLAEAIAYVGRQFAQQLREAEFFAKVLGFVVTAAVKVVEVAAKMGSSMAQEALPGLRDVQAEVKGWTTSIGTAAERTENFSAGALALAVKAGVLAKSLETTRGKIVDVTRAQTDAAAKARAAEEAARKQADAVKDQAAELKKTEEAAKKYAASLKDITDELTGGKAIAKALEWVDALKTTVPVTDMTKEAQAKVNKVMREALDAYDTLGQTAPKAIEQTWLATADLTIKTGELSDLIKYFPGIKLDNFVPPPLPGKVKEVEEKTVDLMDTVKDLAGSFTQLAQVSDGAFGDIAQDIGIALGAMVTADKGRLAFQDGLKGLGKEGGATVANFGKMASGAIAMAGAFMQATEGADALDGAMKGAAVGFSIGGPWGAAIGAGIGALRGFTEQQNKLKSTRIDFIHAAGGMDALRKAADRANISLDGLMGARNTKDLERRITAIKDALAAQDAAMATLDETTKRYGFTIEELGPALARQELDTQAQQIFKDWQVLNAAGIDTVAIATRMSESVNAYVNDAIAMGVEVPEAMRPMLQKMIEMGTLTDAQGTKIEDLEGSGITFTMTMTEGFTGIIDEVRKLTDAITRGLGLAIDDASEKLERLAGIEVIDKGKGKGGKGGKQGVPAYQGGTDGFKDFGSGTLVMLHGWEAVVPRENAAPSGALSLLAGAGAGGPGAPDIVQITINAQGAFFDTPGSLQQLASRVEEALSARHGLKNKRRAA